MRTYGLLKNITVASLVLVLSLVPLGANLVRVPRPPCHTSIHLFAHLIVTRNSRRMQLVLAARYSPYLAVCRFDSQYLMQFLLGA